MGTEKYYLFYVLALVAEVIGTVSGFGSSILFVPLASLFFDFKIVLGITAIFHVFSNLSKLYLFRNGIDKAIAIKMGIPAIAFVILGAALSKVIPQKDIELMMSLMVLGMAIYLLINFNKSFEKSNSNLVKGGIISGFTAGLVGTGGAIRGLTLTAFNLSKTVFIATSAFIDLGVDTSRAIVYFLNGYVHKEFLITIPILLVISLLGSYLGKIILTKIAENTFKYIVLVVIILTTAVQFIKYFN